MLQNGAIPIPQRTPNKSGNCKVSFNCSKHRLGILSTLSGVATRGLNHPNAGQLFQVLFQFPNGHLLTKAAAVRSALTAANIDLAYCPLFQVLLPVASTIQMLGSWSSSAYIPLIHSGQAAVSPFL